MVSLSTVTIRDLSYIQTCKAIARFECLTTPPRNNSNMTTRSFEKEQKAGSRYTVERPKMPKKLMLTCWMAGDLSREMASMARFVFFANSYFKPILNC